jgi:luciferase family oxidoreductase group 1
MPILGVLDQSPVRSGAAPVEAIGETLALAQVAERLGYHRYWLAEHHSTPGLGGTSPEVLVARVASVTSRIRVGAGGVMLQHYSPLKVAESFRVLETLFPGRIDLGIGRAPGSDPLTASALVEGRSSGGPPLRFEGKVVDLLGFVHGDLPPEHPYARVLAMPTGPTAPEVWLLGSSDASAAIAARLGLAFSFAHFINDEGGAEVTRAYQRAFKPSRSLEAPRASVAVFVVCAETAAEADRLARSRDLFVVRLYTGRAGRYPTVAEAEAHAYTEMDRAIVAHARRRLVAGTPAECRDRLLALGAAYGVDEFVIVTITESWATRRHSYELLAGAFGLG